MKFILFLFCCFGSLTYCAGIPTYGGDTSANKPAAYHYHVDWAMTDAPEINHPILSGSPLLPQQSTESPRENPDNFVAPLLPQNYPSTVSKRIGESLHLYCGFDRGDLDSSQIRSLSWWKYRNDGHPEMISSDDNRVYINFEVTEKEYLLWLIINNIQGDDARDYFCDAMTSIDSQWQRNNVKLVVTE